jgi:hypothetical protein
MFTNRAKTKYKVVAAMSDEEEVALTLLASGVADEFYNMIDDEDGAKQSGDDLPYYEKLRGMIERPQEDIVEEFKSASKDLHIDVKKYLPVELVKKMIHEWESKTKVPFKEMPSKEQHRLVLNCLGHGVSPFDDTDFFDWLEEHKFDAKAVEKSWHGSHAHFENDHNKIWDWLQEATQALKDAE